MRRVVAAVTLSAAALAGCSGQAASHTAPATPAGKASAQPTGGARALDSEIDVRGVPHRLDVLTLNGGRLEQVTGPDGSSWLRFPRFQGNADAPSAVVAIWPTGQGDTGPGMRAFSYGGDFRLDRESAGSQTDNGDNLMQRGLFSSDAQFKIQIDNRVPSCRVKGTDGELLVEAEEEADPSKWYRIRCYRRGEHLRLTLGTYVDGKVTNIGTYETTGPIGAVTLPGDVPLSVGGKLTGAGEVAASSTDQFNGWIANVYVHLDR